MRKGQFFFNFLRDYMGEGNIKNPYPSCHRVFFNISDEYWDIMENEYLKFKNNPQKYNFPQRPFGDSVISKEHAEAISFMFKDILKK